MNYSPLNALLIFRRRMLPFRDVISSDKKLPNTLARELAKNNYPVRLLRYWLAGSALAAEAKRLGRPLRVVDLGCEKGWLKFFTPRDAVAEWTGLDWNPRMDQLASANYDRIVRANFDEPLPIESGTVDAVVSLHVFEHLPRPGFTIAEVSRILTSGGIFFAGAPTLPGLFARWRERWFRNRFRKGLIPPGGHINSLAPGRWRQLAYEVGLRTEVLTGSHAMRLSGNPLENYRWWIRLNQLWAACFPSLGTECFIQARREESQVRHPVPLAGYSTWRIRPYAIGSVFAALIAAIFVLFSQTNSPEVRDAHHPMDAWITLEQDGNDVFYVYHTRLASSLANRSDVLPIENAADLSSLLTGNNDPHVILSPGTASEWIDALRAESYFLSSHLRLSGQDYYLFERKADASFPHSSLSQPSS